jgi:hypothetical protein
VHSTAIFVVNPTRSNKYYGAMHLRQHLANRIPTNIMVLCTSLNA